MIRNRLARWWRPPADLPSEVFVICECGTPVVVCLDRASVQQETRDRPKAVTRVHQIPLTRQDVSHGE